MVKDSEFVEYIVKSLVDNPNEVKIDRKVDEMGEIIGRQGATAKAIRTLLRVVGMKNNARVNLKINEPAEMLGAQSGEGYRSHLDDVDAVMDGIKNI